MKKITQCLRCFGESKNTIITQKEHKWNFVNFEIAGIKMVFINLIELVPYNLRLG